MTPKGDDDERAGRLRSFDTLQGRNHCRLSCIGRETRTLSRLAHVVRNQKRVAYFSVVLSELRKIGLNSDARIVDRT